MDLHCYSTAISVAAIRNVLNDLISKPIGFGFNIPDPFIVIVGKSDYKNNGKHLCESLQHR
eukprot:UN16199